MVCRVSCSLKSPLIFRGKISSWRTDWELGPTWKGETLSLDSWYFGTLWAYCTVLGSWPNKSSSKKVTQFTVFPASPRHIYCRERLQEIFKSLRSSEWNRSAFVHLSSWWRNSLINDREKRNSHSWNKGWLQRLEVSPIKLVVNVSHQLFTY